MRTYVQIKPEDNVAIAVHELPKGAEIMPGVVTLSDIPQAHKIALRDIPKDADYAEAVIWARKNRITNGTGNGIFSPDLTVDRATLIAFLWKQAGDAVVVT